MKKNLKWIIVGLIVLALCTCCALSNKRANPNTLIVEDGVIKYSNNGKLVDVISLEDLLTAKNNLSTIENKEVEFFVEDGYIVWNYVGETSMHKLIAMETLVGKQGATGATGPQGAKGEAGEDGTNAYIWVKYLDNAPEVSSDSDLKDTASSYMGIYYGSLQDAPTDIVSYEWFNIKGEKGETGATGPQGAKGEAGVDGTNAYIWIKYLDNAPEVSSDSDLKDVASSYMGVYYGTLANAPTDIASYQWYNIKGEKGDTGATGATGATGPQGPQGTKGEKGDTGATGATGPQGPQGAKGDKGDTGATGATGPQGPQGEKGDSYLDSVAIVSCSNSNSMLVTSCELKYKGDNIDVSLAGNHVFLNPDANHAIEIDGNVYFKTTSGTRFKLGFSYGNYGTQYIFDKTLSSNETEYYGRFYDIYDNLTGENKKLIGPINVNYSPNTGIEFPYHYEYTLKVYKK
ncbi:MAG: hypothetical protein PUF50_03695 [Erysipelotrichaceae bacterium]|nr:hypothetical protein [Erysipelotrichaceae bacterium]